jgi:ABC-type transporter Mla subunit MlaD
MAAQDLTPQLRTRLGRIEKTVGWFVTFATLLLLAGLAYYIYSVAARKGWFRNKAPYFTYLNSGAGIKVGDPVRLMGFTAGQITKIVPEDPGKEYNVYVEMILYAPDFGYVWDDSVVKVKAAGFLGERFLEVTKGGTRLTNDVHATYKTVNGKTTGKITGIYVDQLGIYTNWNTGDAPYWLPSEEPPELAAQLDQMVQVLKVSLTNILGLTNAITRTLTNAAEVTANLNDLLLEAKPLVANANAITANLKDPRGSLGEWLFPVAMNYQVTSLLTNANSTVSNVNTTVSTAQGTLVNANATVTNANTNLVVVFSNITVSLENLASMTSNLNAQVQSNHDIVSSLSRLIVNSDDMVQGLKRHWLLRSAFKDKGASTPPPRPTNSKGAGRE